MRVVLLKPSSSLVTELRSDTLWGLIITAISKLYSEEKLRELLDSYAGNNPFFLISSAFPYREDGDKRIYYFPKPLLHSEITIPEQLAEKTEKLAFLQRLKQYKRVKYVSKKVFEKFLAGTLNDVCFFSCDTWKHQKPLYQQEIVSHNTISRTTWTTLDIDNSGQLFTTEETFFSKNSGLYFLVHGERLEQLDAALRLLQHTGFGGDISTGKGVFKFDSSEITIRQPEVADKFVTLSLFSPSSDEVSRFKARADSLSYEVEMRKGRLGRDVSAEHEKDGVLMFREGSVFPSLSSETYGINHTVREMQGDLPYSVQHYGMPIYFNIKA